MPNVRRSALSPAQALSACEPRKIVNERGGWSAPSAKHFFLLLLLSSSNRKKENPGSVFSSVSERRSIRPWDPFIFRWGEKIGTIAIEG